MAGVGGMQQQLAAMQLREYHNAQERREFVTKCHITCLGRADAGASPATGAMQLREYNDAQVGHRGNLGQGSGVGWGVAVPPGASVAVRRCGRVGPSRCGGAASCFACAFMQLWEYHDAQ